MCESVLLVDLCYIIFNNFSNELFEKSAVGRSPTTVSPKQSVCGEWCPKVLANDKYRWFSQDGYMSLYQVTVDGSDCSFFCDGEQNVLKGMEKLSLRGIPVGCRGGGCGICRVQVLAGKTRISGKMSRAQVTVEDEKEGIALACRLLPESDLRLKVLGKWKRRLVSSTSTES